MTGETFLARWSRLKRAEPRAPDPDPAPQAPLAAAAAQPAVPPPAPLPPVEELRPESDFAPFMRPDVDAATRRSALKRLFADPHFNVPDPFEPYSADFTGGGSIPEQMLKTLNHARRLLARDHGKPADAAPAPDAPLEDAKNAAGRQDA